jgi:hypothetical protein
MKYGYACVSTDEQMPAMQLAGAYRNFKRYFATVPSGMHPLGWGGHRTPPNPAPGGWPGARPAASRTPDGERYRVCWRGVTGSIPQPAALRRSGPCWGRRWDHENCRRAGSEKQACYEADTTLWHTLQRRRRLGEKLIQRWNSQNELQ